MSLREKKKGQYGRTAVVATKYVREDKCAPEDAWWRAAREIICSDESFKKGCPRYAYLGLCEDGRVVGVCKGNYTDSFKNKTYAIIALDLLLGGFSVNKTELWREVQCKFREQYHEEPASSQQGAVDVAYALWKADLAR